MTDAMHRYLRMSSYQQSFVADFLVTQVSEQVLEQALRYGQLVEDRNGRSGIGSSQTTNA
jgi:hypothetical protein